MQSEEMSRCPALVRKGEEESALKNLSTGVDTGVSMPHHSHLVELCLPAADLSSWACTARGAHPSELLETGVRPSNQLPSPAGLPC